MPRGLHVLASQAVFLLATAAAAQVIPGASISKDRAWAAALQQYGGQAPAWRLTFTATLLGSTPPVFVTTTVAQAQLALQAIARRTGVHAVLTRLPYIQRSADQRQLSITIQGVKDDEAALTKLGRAVQASQPGLLGPAVPAGAVAYSGVNLIWVCRTGQILCIGICVNAGTAVVAVQSAGFSVTAAAGNSSATKPAGQRWTITPSGIGPDSFLVTAVDGSEARAAALAAGGAAPGAFSIASGDGACRSWRFGPEPGGTFTITCDRGGAAPTSDKVSAMSVGGAAAQFTVQAVSPVGSALVDVAAAGVAPAVVDAAAPVYLGGAFETGLLDLVRFPGKWLTTAAAVGYWSHPMGMVPMLESGRLPRLLSLFGRRSFVYEMDLFDSTSTPTLLDQAFTGAKQVLDASTTLGMATLSCDGYAPWVAGNHLARPDEVVARYQTLQQHMSENGFARPFFFYAPPSPEALTFADVLLNRRRDGISLVEWIVRNAGLQGILLDFPAHLVLSKNYPVQYKAGSGDKARALAKQAHDVARKLGIPFGWVFNGGDASIQAAMDAIRGLGMRVDIWAIDNFVDPDRRGIPETNPLTLAGQALSAVTWLRRGGAPPRTTAVPTTCEPFQAFGG